MPKPSTLRNTPLLAFSSISRTSSPRSGDADVEVAVGGEDHAVRAPLDEVAGGRCRRRARCPAPPLVEPPACEVVRCAERIICFLSQGVEGKHQARGPGVDDDGHAVVLAEFVRPAAAAVLTSGSLLGCCIEPETSTRKTRLLSGRSVAATRLPLEAERGPADGRRSRGSRRLRRSRRTGRLPSGCG